MSSGNNQSKIISALESLVEKRRIVFWYDESGEMEETVKSLSLPGIEVMKLDRNPLEDRRIWLSPCQGRGVTRSEALRAYKTGTSN